MFFTTKAFWSATAERAVKSFGQGALAAVGVDLASAWSLDYVAIGGIGAGTALASVLTSLASASIGEKGSPSLGPETLAKKVEAVVDPESPTGAVAGEGSHLPEGIPVEVEPYGGSTKVAATLYAPQRGHWDGIRAWVGRLLR